MSLQAVAMAATAPEVAKVRTAVSMAAMGDAAALVGLVAMPRQLRSKVPTYHLIQSPYSPVAVVEDLETSATMVATALPAMAAMVATVALAVTLEMEPQ